MTPTVPETDTRPDAKFLTTAVVMDLDGSEWLRCFCGGQIKTTGQGLTNNVATYWEHRCDACGERSSHTRRWR